MGLSVKVLMNTCANSHLTTQSNRETQGSKRIWQFREGGNSTMRTLGRKPTTTKLHSRRPGFTLIELLVVVVIIGILASVALPSFVGAQDKARNAGVQANVNTVRMGLEQYSTDNNGSYPTTTGVTGSLLLSNNYLPGNNLPRSPWNKKVQASGLPGVASPFIAASNIASGSALPSLNTTAAQISTSGHVADDTAGPALPTDYGAIEYNLDAPSQTYVVYSTGKKAKAAIIAAQVSNGGN